MGINRKAAAVESLQIRAAEVIRGADKLRSDARDSNPSVSRGFGRLTGNTATGNEQQRRGDRECVAQELNLRRPPRSVQLESCYSQAQPAARTSLISGFALILRA